MLQHLALDLRPADGAHRRGHLRVVPGRVHRVERGLHRLALTLRPDITFHNGTRLTEQTIADMFPLQQASAAGSAGLASAKVEGVAATGDLTVEYTLSAPNVAFPSFLATAPIGFPFDPAAAAADSAATAPRRSGPARS